MDPLVEIPREKWPELRDLYKPHWPEGVEACCLLDFKIENPALAREFQFHVYCPDGNFTNGMIATSQIDDYFQVVIQPIGKNIIKIIESLFATNVIDWNRNLVIPFANASAIECIDKIKDQLGLKVIYNEKTKAYIHFLDKSSKKFDDLTLPPNTYIGYLRPEHIDVVDKTWAYHSKRSRKTFEILMKYNLSYVLYSKSKAETDKYAKLKQSKEKSDSVNQIEKDKDASNDQEMSTTFLDDHSKDDKDLNEDVDEPLAWLSINEHGALSHLYCSEKHRRKGYGEILTKYVANELLSKGLNILAFTVEDNKNPKNLFRKLGFKDLGYDYWVIVYKPTKK